MSDLNKQTQKKIEDLLVKFARAGVSPNTIHSGLELLILIDNALYKSKKRVIRNKKKAVQNRKKQK